MEKGRTVAAEENQEDRKATAEKQIKKRREGPIQWTPINKREKNVD